MEFLSDIQKAVEVLRAGGVILYPTDTVWGLGCDATNSEAVAKIYEIKQRNDAKSMLVLMENPNLLNSYIVEVPEIAYDLIELSEKPITIIYPKAKNLSSSLFATDGFIGIRITTEKFSAELIRRFRKPIVSTSANISGKPTPQSYSEIEDEIIQAVDYVVGYCQNDTEKCQPSSIVKLGVGGQIEIIKIAIY